MDKNALRETLAARLEAELAVIEAAQRATAEAATHEEAKPENDKDTRALEQSYLARGQAQRALELRTAIAETRAMAIRAFAEGDPIALSALVTIEDDKGEQTVFVTRHGGGEEIDGVRVVTVRSPLGRALLGKTEGDDAGFEQAGRARTFSIARVR
ncbi:MAG TPA: GreA/GreB family elongation factor [Polyangiaceae bacterium]